MTPQDILLALKDLDPEDDSDWTQDGQPLLSKLGGDVTRKEVLAVAPLFNRSNAELEDAFDRQEEKEQAQAASLEKELLDIQAAKDAAEAEITAAAKALNDAQAKLKQAESKLDDVRRAEINSDKRSDTQINMDLLASGFRERLERAGQQKQARELLFAAGLNNKDIRMLTGSPLDRNIAARVLRERRGR